MVRGGDSAVTINMAAKETETMERASIINGFFTIWNTIFYFCFFHFILLFFYYNTVKVYYFP